jgi:hypothetical protein
MARLQQLWNLTEAFGARLPAELIVETDAAKRAVLAHMPGTALAFTDGARPAAGRRVTRRPLRVFHS